MKPEVWGPHAWIFLHSVTFDYPDKPTSEDKKNYKNFFNNLKFVLPCEMCRNHFHDNLKKFPLTDRILSSRKNLIEWLIDLHNGVNKFNNKPTLKYQEVVKKYLDYYEGVEKPNNSFNYQSISPNIIGIISILFITLFILKKRIFLNS